MRLQEHIIISSVAAVALAPAWGVQNSLIFLVSAVMIDSDHYLDYLYRTKAKDWSPARMFRYYDKMSLMEKNDPEMLGFSLCHNAEIFLLVYLLAVFTHLNLFMVILSGMFFHLILDMFWLKHNKVFFIRSYSLVEHHIRKRLLLKKGLNPQNFFDKLFKLSVD